MQHSKIGIMLPFKNEEQHLTACLTSIQQQTESDFIVMMVDDHSDDNGTHIAKSFAAQDSRFIYQLNPGTGVISALTAASKALYCTYITRMDGDDIMPNHKLSTLVQQVKKGEIVTGTVRYFGNVSEGYLNYEHWVNQTIIHGLFSEELFRECVIPACSWMMLKSDFDNATRWSEMQLPEDYHLLLQWHTHGLRFKGIPNMVHWWRHHKQRTSLTHPGYQMKAFTALKWQIVSTHYINPNDSVVLWGKGDKMKILRDCLDGQKHSYEVLQNPKTATATLKRWVNEQESVKVISVVGSEKGLISSRQTFAALGLKQNYNFFLF